MRIINVCEKDLESMQDIINLKEDYTKKSFNESFKIFNSYLKTNSKNLEHYSNLLLNETINNTCFLIELCLKSILIKHFKVEKMKVTHKYETLLNDINKNLNFNRNIFKNFGGFKILDFLKFIDDKNLFVNSRYNYIILNHDNFLILYFSLYTIYQIFYDILNLKNINDIDKIMRMYKEDSLNYTNYCEYKDYINNIAINLPIEFEGKMDNLENGKGS